jgi:hypothetical protein
VFPGARQALDAQLTHDGQGQLLVDYHVLLALEGGSDPQHPVGSLAWMSATRPITKSRRM